MLALLDAQPDIYLDEIAEQLEHQHSVTVSLSTIWCTLKALGLSAKKLCLIFLVD